MLLETIRCEGGVPLHLSYHQERLNRSLSALGSDAQFDLTSLISPPSRELYRCRFLYDANGYTVEFHPYAHRKIGSLKLVHADWLDYPLKDADRSALDLLYDQRGGCDDVLIVRRGLLTDTTIANIALFIDAQWKTPVQPLLEGTTRARLIREGELIPAALGRDDLARAEKIALMNAMMGFVEVENGIIGIN